MHKHFRVAEKSAHILQAKKDLDLRAALPTLHSTPPRNRRQSAPNLLARHPTHHPWKRRVQIYRDLVRRTAIHIVDVARLRLAALEDIIRHGVRGALVRAAGYVAQGRAEHKGVAGGEDGELVLVDARVRVRGRPGAAAADVELCEGVAAEDVVDAIEGGGPVRCVAGEVAGGRDDLHGVEDVAGTGEYRDSAAYREKSMYCCYPPDRTLA